MNLTRYRTRPRKVTALVGTAAVLGLAVSTFAAGTALADYAPASGDVVSVSGATPQFAADFVSNGDFLGHAGYNAAGNVNRYVNFDATADGNGRDAYANGSTLASPKALSPSVVYRAGSNPVQRLQSSGNDLTALLSDTGAQENINFAVVASEPTAAQQSTAASNGWGYLHVVQLGTDPEVIVTPNVSNAPAGLSTAELLGIYKGTYLHWNDLPGNSGGSSDAIVPLLPPSSSSINKTFIADLTTLNGGSFTLGGDVVTVEQNDPGAVTTAGADAIAPFAQSRLNLYNSGYFHNITSIPYPQGAVLTSGVKVISGTAPDSAASYTDVNGVYAVFRQSDFASTTPFQPGATKNWVQALLSTTAGTPFFKSSAGQALIAAGGDIAGYNDLGDVSHG
jgi:ABC-type phosphate transport system substrate-binding protein